jgi:hypothetical protein
MVQIVLEAPRRVLRHSPRREHKPVLQRAGEIPRPVAMGNPGTGWAIRHWNAPYTKLHECNTSAPEPKEGSWL